MKLTSILLRNVNQSEKKVPLKAMTPMVLKNYVTRSNRKVAESGCLYEVSLLLSCLEENENENKNCIPQFNALHACYENYSWKMKEHKIQSGNIIPTPNSKNQTSAQIGYLFRKYKTP
ncbi:coiled-coil-helix-coiled-coil-helix domain-containing protein 1 [Odontomachus brunneus]|uniref:coiled-coil-helix-coiled-coil-helix domain-containing protein 1 n=1 Tax=Odontomachus brunneus TaxID=486640 RepID=UPI0013F24546|nr:coiled-coil-helix-coiled-coil-helix domain-containing protein 1 [Odontomachus brunneus]XP_032673535.1 coiled-coil-helix-coiled-coil-helix domain-containing protein 1 [Odontomachus brunneus]